MNYLTYSQEEHGKYPLVFLVNQIQKSDIQKEYIDPFQLNLEEILVLDLHYSTEKKKTPVAEMKQYFMEEVLPILQECQTKYIVVNDPEYFKALTKVTKCDMYLGYVLDCAWASEFKVIYVPNYKRIFYNPEVYRSQIKQGIMALVSHRIGVYADPGKSIIKNAYYPQTYDEIILWLERLLEMDQDLTCDIEGFSLKHYSAGIGTITFCWNESEGVAFPVDLGPDGTKLRAALKIFFENFKRKMIYHNIAFDVTVLIYQLFMDHLCDTAGLLYGLEVMLRDWEDTKLIVYLATNSCAGNKLGLKYNSQEYSGNYAVEEINDIRKIPLPELLQYNLVDGLSTWYVYRKFQPIMIQDQQLKFYEEIFKPAMIDIIQMQLTGLPIDMERVLEVEKILQNDSDTAVQKMMATNTVQKFIYELNEDWVVKRNAKLKVKRVSLADANETFNPNSGPQLIKLLYGENQMGLPVIDTTDTGLPSTGKDTVKSLKNHTDDPDKLAFLDALVSYLDVNIILTTFIPAFKNAQEYDGWHYLFGNFNLGGTVSGRLSSNGPNLQNLPATGSKYAKLIKTCFKAPPGWLFCGLDFASLEDRISALTTKDPQKLKVYTDGYDGHSLRAYAYFGNRMPDIDPTSVESINSIQVKYKAERQESKAPTFALTYQGTFKTLMNNCGFSEEKAKDVETKYHVLYKVSDDWVAAKLDQASKDGYVTVAFGLRVRTPLLAQVIRGTKYTPFEAEAEGRTAGNALGQSWCLLNSRACSEFMGKVRQSEFRLDIRPCAQIHDANYYMIRDDFAPILYTNEHLVKAVEWQDHPDIYHDEVKLGGEFSIFYPDWSKELTIPNGATQEVLEQKISEHMAKL